jgi:hypothetical protein
MLIEDSALRIKFGKAGRKTVVERYSIDANNDLYIQHFNALLKT